MLEIIAAYVVGQMIIGPNLIQTDYLNEDNQIITIIESIQETNQ